MTFIKIDPTALRLALTKVSSFTTSYEQSASSIRSKNFVEGCPADLSSLATADTSVGELKSTVSEIKTRIESAEQIGSSGITFSGCPTGSFYIVPDDLTDTAASVKSTTSSIMAAGADAKLIQTAVDSKDYSTASQLVHDRVATHERDETYAAVLADQLGARKVTLVAAHLNPGSQDTRTWTAMFAAATRSGIWSDEHRDHYASDLAALVTTTGDMSDQDASFNLPIGFNRLLSADDREVHIPSPEEGPGPSAYTTDALALNARFLTRLGQEIMTDETTGSSQDGWAEYAKSTASSGGGYSNLPNNTRADTMANRGLYDPMTGILAAMGRQPQAALDFLAPTKPDGTVDGSTWTWVTSRSLNAISTESLTAALASAASLREKTFPSLQQEDNSQNSSNEKRATWLTEQGTVMLGNLSDDDVWSTKEGTKSYRNVAVMLSYCMGDIDDSANAYNYKLLENNSFAASLPEHWSETHGIEITKLLQRILTDDTALHVMSEVSRTFAAERMLTIANEMPLGVDPRAAYEVLLEYSKNNAKLYGFIFGACAKGREDKEADKDFAIELMVSLISGGVSFTSISGQPWVSKLISAYRSDVTKATKSALANNKDNTSSTQEGLQNSVKAGLNAEVIATMAAVNIIPKDAFINADGKPKFSWIFQDEDGNWHVDVHKALEDTNRKGEPENFDSWISTLAVSLKSSTCGGGKLPAVPPSNEATIDDAFEKGLTEGRKEF